MQGTASIGYDTFTSILLLSQYSPQPMVAKSADANTGAWVSTVFR